MILPRVIALIYAGFSTLVLAYNVFTPNNPDHVSNVALTLGITLASGISYISSLKITKAIHLIILAAAAIQASFTATGFFTSAALMVSTFVLSYAYGGFKTMAAWKLPVSAVLVYGICLNGVRQYSEPVEIYSRAAIWELFIAMFLAFLWLVLHEIRRQFFAEFAHELVEQNHDLIEQVRDLTKRCKDADAG